MTKQEFDNLKVGTLLKFKSTSNTDSNTKSFCIGKIIKEHNTFIFKKIYENAVYANYFVDKWELYPEEYFNDFDIISNEEYMILRLEND